MSCGEVRIRLQLDIQAIKRMSSGLERWESHLLAEWRIKGAGMRAGMIRGIKLANPLLEQWGRSTHDIESSLDALQGKLDTVLSKAAVCECAPVHRP
jgi:hypothetical protein